MQEPKHKMFDRGMKLAAQLCSTPTDLYVVQTCMIGAMYGHKIHAESLTPIGVSNFISRNLDRLDIEDAKGNKVS